MGAAFLLIITTFCLVGQAEQSHKQKMAALEDQIAKLQPLAAASLAAASTTASHSSIKLENLLLKSQSTYAADEKNRTEGFLWRDRRTNTFVVTLGALNGLRPGSELSIYDGNEKIDTATVDLPFDIVSYVKPVKNSPDFFNGGYYRAVMEDHLPR